MQTKLLVLVFVFLILGPSNCELRNRLVNKFEKSNSVHHKIRKLQQNENKDFEKLDNRAMIGAVLGFPLGYVTGQSTLASSGDDDPSAGAFAHGLAGAAAGYLIASKWGEEETAIIEAPIDQAKDSKELQDAKTKYKAAKDKLDTEEKKLAAHLETLKDADTPEKKTAFETEKKKITDDIEAAKKAMQTEINSLPKEKKKDDKQLNSEEIKTGAMAGLVAGAIGSTFSGSSGGSGGNTKDQNANT